MMARVQLMDIVFFGYLLVIIGLLAMFGKNRVNAGLHIAMHAGFLALAIVILVLNGRRPGRFLFFCRTWYVPFFYVFIFEELGQIIHLVQPQLFDWWVMDVEAWVFGGYPVKWLQHLANPWLTETMALFYMSYYFLIPALGLPLYFEREWDKVNDLVLTTAVTFFFCFLHYLFMPVAGPIFIPGDLPFELFSLAAGPGTTLEQWVFSKGAIRGAAFPSSHVAVAVAVLVLAVKYRRGRWVFAILVTGLAISTVYNGYHYGVDVIYGVLVGLVFALVCPYLNRVWNRARDESQRSGSGVGRNA